MMYDAHIICRFSSQDKEDASIKRQKETCLEVAGKLGLNLSNIKVIANDNLSGALPWQDRTDMVALEGDIKAGLCKRVIVYRFDRLSRDFEVSGKLLNLVRKYGIEVYDESGKLDHASAAGAAFFGMKTVFASFEREMIKDRTYAGKKQKAKNGLYVGGSIPLGYILDSSPRLPDGSVNPNYNKIKPYPPHAEIVKEIFQRLASNKLTPFTLSLAFNKEGRIIPDFSPETKEVMAGDKNRTGLTKCMRKGNGYRITPKLIRSIIINRVYIGVWKWGKVEVENNHEPIISTDLFNSVNRVQYSNITARKGRAAYTEPLPFTKLLYCHEHNCLMHAHSKKKLYCCNHDYRIGESNRGHLNFPAYVLDKPLGEFIMRQCNFSNLTEKLIEERKAEKAESDKRKNILAKDRTRLEQEINNLKEGLATARNNNERLLFLDSINERKATIESIEGELNVKPKNSLSKKDTALIQKLLHDTYSFWDKTPDRFKNRILSILIKRIDIQVTDEEGATGKITAKITWWTDDVQEFFINYHSYWRQPDWTEDEVEILKRVWPSELREKVIEMLPNRSWGSIKTKAIRLKVKRNSKSIKKGGKKWSPEEVDALKDFFDSGDDSKLNQLNRSPRAVYEKANKLGLIENNGGQRVKLNWNHKDSYNSNDKYIHARRGDESMSVRLL